MHPLDVTSRSAVQSLDSVHILKRLCLSDCCWCWCTCRPVRASMLTSWSIRRRSYHEALEGSWALTRQRQQRREGCQESPWRNWCIAGYSIYGVGVATIVETRGDDAQQSNAARKTYYGVRASWWNEHGWDQKNIDWGESLRGSLQFNRLHQSNHAFWDSSSSIRREKGGRDYWDCEERQGYSINSLTAWNERAKRYPF